MHMIDSTARAKLDILHVPSKVFPPYLTKCTRWISAVAFSAILSECSLGGREEQGAQKGKM